MTIRNVRRKLDAFSVGGPLPIYKTRVTRISGNPIVVAFVRMSAESRPWGIAYGRAQESEPKFLTVPDPRGKETVQGMMDTFAKWILEEMRVENFSPVPLSLSSNDSKDLPQIWFPGASHVDMLHFLQYQYQVNRNLDSEPTPLGAFGRLAGFLFRQSRLKGNQMVIDATKLLNELYEFPADDYSLSHLGAQLAWLKTPGPLNEKRDAAISASSETISITMSPELEREKLSKSVKELNKNGNAEGYSNEQSAKIKLILIPELNRRWRQTVEAHNLAFNDGKQNNAGVEVLVSNQFESFCKYFNEPEKRAAEGEDVYTPAANTDYSAFTSAREFLTVTDWEDSWLPTLVHGDVSILRDSLIDGGSFVGTVVETGLAPSGDGLAPFWRVKLSPRSAKYYKRRELAKLCIYGHPKYKLRLDSFEQINGDWVMNLTWTDPKNAITFENGKSGLQKDSHWVGDSLAFVPQLRSFFSTNMKALTRAASGAGSFLFNLPLTSEVEDVND